MKYNMKRSIAFFLFLSLTTVAFAQETVPTDTIVAPADTTAALADTIVAPKPQYWTKSLTTQIGFSQLSLTNWAAGGYGSISLNTFAAANANYKRDKLIWDNQLQVGYGFIQSFDDGYKKSDDRLILDSKVGYKAVETLYASALFNLRTQFAKGYDNKGNFVADFFTPAYVSLGFGVDYKPYDNFSINFAPLTGKLVMVKNKELRAKYGNAEDQFCKFELGAQLKVDGKIEVENFKVVSSLTLFSDYLNKPQNVKVYWDVNADAKITKFFSVSIRTNLIYDDTIRFIDKTDKQGNPVLDENGKTIKIPGVQFKELFSVGLSYTFGSKK